MSTPRTSRGSQLGNAGSNPVAASADGKTRNTLGINMVRLPIGHSAEDPRPAGPRTMFWVVIPTNTGGRLICKHLGGGILTLLAHDGRLKIAGNSSDLLDIAIHPGTHGLMYVAADGGTRREVTARFVQVAFAREGVAARDKPLIPWNFWFFPSARTYLDGKVNPDAAEPEAIVRKFVHAMKTDPKEASDIADKAAKWEHDNHGADVGPDWLGHCHNAAGASIVFEPPIARTVNGQSFSDNDLGLIAAELFGNIGSARNAFVLRGTAPGMGPPQMFSRSGPGGLPFESEADLQREAGPVFASHLGNLFYPMCFKPSEAKSADIGTLARALMAFDRTMPPEEASRLARRAFATMNIQRLLNDWFGELAARFYFTLVECILKGKHALEGDLASKEATAGPEEVWNHAVFYYEAEFSETNFHGDPTRDNNDPRDVTISIDLVANEDEREKITDPSTGSVTISPRGMPAGVTTGGGVDLDRKFSKRHSRQVLRLVFSDAGEITFDPRNEWLRSMNMDLEKQNTRLSTVHVPSDTYAPRYLAWMELNFSEAGLIFPPNLAPLSRGNVTVQLDAISGPNPLLTLRKRFRP